MDAQTQSTTEYSDPQTGTREGCECWPPQSEAATGDPMAGGREGEDTTKNASDLLDEVIGDEVPA